MASLTTSLLSFLLPAKSPAPTHSSRVSVRCSNEADAMAVMWPSVANSKTLYAKSAYNVQVVVDDNEPEERLMNRFRREVMRAGVIQECKRRRYHENKQDEKKRRVRDAAKRNRRRRPPPKFAEQNTSSGPTPSSKREDDEDNWDLPQGKIPY